MIAPPIRSADGVYCVEKTIPRGYFILSNFYLGNYFFIQL